MAPKTVAIIMDGNGRWAKKRGLPRTAGHKKGADTIRTVALAAQDMGIQKLILYAFSTENWKRPEDEVSYLCKLPGLFFNKYINEFYDNVITKDKNYNTICMTKKGLLYVTNLIGGK